MLGLVVAQANATEVPPLSPRLETGTHVAPIRAVASDPSGQFLLTAGEDKTARLWEASTGRLLQVFRPPSSRGNDGKLFAASMRPDAQLFAVGGWTAGNDVYLVQRGSGRIRQRITGLPNVVTGLAFSPDGGRLAVGLWGQHGVRLFESTDDWRSVRELAGASDFGGEVLGMTWSADGRRLAVSSADAVLRMYASGPMGLQPSHRQAVGSRTIPHGLAFSPSGAALAVGSASGAEVLVIDGHDLSPLWRLGIDEIGKPGGWSSLAWADDETLIAAGTRRAQNGDFTVCVARKGDTGCRREVGLARNTVTGMVRLGEGRVAFATTEPAWGVLSGTGTVIHRVQAETTEFRDQRLQFRLANDGSAVAIPARNGKINGFDLRQLNWCPPGKDWTAPVTRAGRLTVESWFEQRQPRIGTRPISLEANELSLTATVSAGGDRVVLGTNFFLRAYDANGRELWRTAVPGSTWQVNISKDGRWLVGAFSDGSLRWIRMSDGLEQIALFPHPDGRRWIAWTSTGHYAAGPGGEDLLGWQQDQGQDQAADFFPASRLRDRFHRQDIVARILDTADSTAALAAADFAAGRGSTRPSKVAESLPAAIEITAPTDGSGFTAENFKLRFSTRSSKDAPVTAIRVRVNGQPVTPLAPAPTTGGELTIPLPAQDSEVHIFAENKNGVSSPAVLRLKWRGTSPPENIAALYKPKLYVLAVGVSKYALPDIDLRLAAKDAQDFAAAFTKQKGKLYSDVKVQLLTNERATKDEILGGLEWLKREVTSRDVGIMFLAGHGVNDNVGKYYFLPHNADPNSLLRTGVAQSDIKDALNNLAGKIIFFVDTCHSGNAIGSARTRSLGSLIDGFVNELASAENGVIVFTASTGRQLSQEKDSWGNGAFTKAVLEGIDGQADFQKTGKITLKALDYFVAERVKQLTNGAQSPVSITPTGITDFPIALTP